MLHHVLSTMPPGGLTPQTRHLHRPAGLKRWVEANGSLPAWLAAGAASTARCRYPPEPTRSATAATMRAVPKAAFPLIQLVRTACLPECNWAGETKARYGNRILQLVTRGGSRCHLRGAPQECSLQVQPVAMCVNSKSYSVLCWQSSLLMSAVVAGEFLAAVGFRKSSAPLAPKL
jgi:hypothetical protein